MTLTTATLARFLAYAADANNWSGAPLVGGNVGGDPADKGYVLNMKLAGLVDTEEHREMGERCTFLYFTDAGVALAAEHGVEVEA